MFVKCGVYQRSTCANILVANYFYKLPFHRTHCLTPVRSYTRWYSSDRNKHTCFNFQLFSWLIYVCGIIFLPLFTFHRSLIFRLITCSTEHNNFTAITILTLTRFLSYLQENRINSLFVLREPIISFQSMTLLRNRPWITHHFLAKVEELQNYALGSLHVVQLNATQQVARTRLNGIYCVAQFFPTVIFVPWSGRIFFRPQTKTHVRILTRCPC